MIKIREVDYIDVCSCCETETKIIKELDSLLSEIDFCEDCWEELIEYVENKLKSKI